MAIEQNIYVAADTVVLTEDQHILLIRRGNEPFKGSWALPGGFVEDDEPLEKAAARELQEETGLSIDSSKLIQLGAYGAPNRDPRFRTVGVTYWIRIPTALNVEGGDDAAEAKWFSINELPDMAFDHAEVVSDALAL